jgi:hydrogenase expression/formation protein HypD
MKYIDEYRNKDLILKLAAKIKKEARQDYTFMEVCGGHTHAIRRFGIPSLLPQNIKLISGPGCPVCVTGKDFIDKAVSCSGMENVIVATFGDLIRIPGSSSSLERERASGSDIRIVLSGLEALEIARNNPGKRIVFPGIGFETTAPGTAVTVLNARKEGIDNFSVLSAHKVMPPAMEAIIKDGTSVDGFICPGHVSVITGSLAFEFIPLKYNIACVVAGFEPVDLMLSVLMLINQVNRKKPGVEIQYNRAVTENGNDLAKRYMQSVFEPCDARWRGLGIISGSGLKLRKEFGNFDAERILSPTSVGTEDEGSCICGEILKGIKTPGDCPLFGTTCTPDNPEGACMVSGEGACNSWYKYRDNG